MKRGGRWTYTVVCVMMAIGRFEMIDYRIGDRVRYHKRHDYNGDATLNGVVGTVSSTTCSPGHIEVTWDEGKYAPKFPFVENVEPFPYPIPAPTPDEWAVAPDLVARLVALAKHAAVSASGHTQDEARAIVAALEPVDPDVKIARDMAAEYGWDEDDRDLEAAVDLATAAIARGRSLATSRDVTPCTREQFEEDYRA